MSSDTETFVRLLKASGYSVTKPRLLVFGALADHEPQSMHQLAEKAREVDRASVYRTVDLLERLGIVQRLHTGWKYKLELSDKFAAHHHHLTCTNCGRTTPMNEYDLEHIIDNLAARHGFQPIAHQIEIQGLCAECRSANSS